MNPSNFDVKRPESEPEADQPKPKQPKFEPANSENDELVFMTESQLNALLARIASLEGQQQTSERQQQFLDQQRQLHSCADELARLVPLLKSAEHDFNGFELPAYVPSQIKNVFESECNAYLLSLQSARAELEKAHDRLLRAPILLRNAHEHAMNN